MCCREVIQVEDSTVLSQSVSATSQETLIYTGPSMNPVLRTGDLLSIELCRPAELRAGDVIVFERPGMPRQVCHRVISVGPEGIVTRGDNNRWADPYVLTFEAVTGRVTYFERSGVRRKILGGKVGMLSGATMWVRRALLAAAARVLREPYRSLGRSGLLRRLLLGGATLRVLSFRRPWGTEFHLMMGTRRIGFLPPGKDRWIIVPPYRLLVDDAALHDKHSFSK